MSPREAVLINGMLCGNSAAMFWPRLLAETSREFPSATAVSLSARTADRLQRDVLHPERAFERDLPRLLREDATEAMRRIIAELEITGPPGPVRLRVTAGGKELAARDLPAECADAEILPYLIAWPLEWAGVPESQWNEPETRGRFEAELLPDRLRCEVDFVAACRHLSEGLYERAITAHFVFDSAGAANTTAP